MPYLDFIYLAPEPINIELAIIFFSRQKSSQVKPLLDRRKIEKPTFVDNFQNINLFEIYFSISMAQRKKTDCKKPKELKFSTLRASDSLPQPLYLLTGYRSTSADEVSCSIVDLLVQGWLVRPCEGPGVLEYFRG